MISSKDEVIKIKSGGLRRHMLEVVTFYVWLILCDVESYKDSRCQQDQVKMMIVESA
ncbi:hypothetical protein HanRHA438_Chr13g0584361 [Helianthus annuus]|uniref:Uncharacterized protein n=1 Tax=Helianthus annuus TaxID=4232 RepID=A0A251SPA3_HELAN|nr:hypothetical protein HanXRQr2_Chr13g0573351 [Helianthus annuus]KAJ0479799.1 hypothetical protein HanIR_Chr13g0624221 [Helianthus annuus]KAJ0847987.1 hypothetical protein HanPSC8_Chr13g0551851 [Helianthus annuus]KAJ0856942.1 hypothetical protein HanRHA438_Chr13g0584361 [Helianthus annuus]